MSGFLVEFIPYLIRGRNDEQTGIESGRLNCLIISGNKHSFLTEFDGKGDCQEHRLTPITEKKGAS